MCTTGQGSQLVNLDTNPGIFLEFLLSSKREDDLEVPAVGVNSRAGSRVGHVQGLGLGWLTDLAAARIEKPDSGPDSLPETSRALCTGSYSCRSFKVIGGF